MGTVHGWQQGLPGYTRRFNKPVPAMNNSAANRPDFVAVSSGLRQACLQLLKRDLSGLARGSRF